MQAGTFIGRGLYLSRSGAAQHTTKPARHFDLAELASVLPSPAQINAATRKRLEARRRCEEIAMLRSSDH